VRPCGQAEARLKEAAKLGFKMALVPKGTKSEGAGITLKAIADVRELATVLGSWE